MDKGESVSFSLKQLFLSPLLSYPFVAPLPSAFLFPYPLDLIPSTPTSFFYVLCRLISALIPPSQFSSPNLSLSPSPLAGTTSRRCSLDHRGMAFWEQPSYARCITNEFRYLQQSVGAKSASSHSLCIQCIINYLPSVFSNPRLSTPTLITPVAKD